MEKKKEEHMEMEKEIEEYVKEQRKKPGLVRLCEIIISAFKSLPEHRIREILGEGRAYGDVEEMEKKIEEHMEMDMKKEEEKKKKKKKPLGVQMMEITVGLLNSLPEHQIREILGEGRAYGDGEEMEKMIEEHIEMEMKKEEEMKKKKKPRGVRLLEILTRSLNSYLLNSRASKP